MTTPEPAIAWQPLTFGGVARFGQASMPRLLLVEGVVALFVAISVMWFLQIAWFPEIERAVARLPAAGTVRNGQLEWPDRFTTRLAEGDFLAIQVDPDDTSRGGQSADVQVELGKSEIRLRSVLGYVAMKYPRGWTLALNETGARSWWGAWRPAVLMGAGMGAVAVLMVSWAMLAVLYAAPVRLIAFFTDRGAGFAACWRVASAALMPGALLFGAAILLYSLHRLDLVGLLFAWLLHVGVGWVYVGIAPFRLPRTPDQPPRGVNPFTVNPDETDPET